MWKIFSFLLAMTVSAATAEASVFVWKDEANGFTVSFPDTWTVQTADTPTTRIRIASPVGEDFATCRVKAEKDGRLKIYPQDLMATAVRETLTRSFWENEVSQYENAAVTEYAVSKLPGAQVDATAIKASFMQDHGNGPVPMQGSMIGSIYGDTRYVASCSARQDQYQKYAADFATIMGAVELDSRYQPFATGYYRDFLADKKFTLPRFKPGTIQPKKDYLIPSGM